MRRKPTSIVLVVLAVLAVTTVGHRAQAASPRVVEIIIDKDNMFQVVGSTKPVIVATPGEALELKITTLAGVHSLTIKELADQGWNILLHEGAGTKTVTLTAPEEPGKYIFECAIPCGDGHDEMRGKLVVKKEK